MLRIFHVPSHLVYASKLRGPGFIPVPPPSGRPLTVRALLALENWDFFDVLHMHTVELTDTGELAALQNSMRRRGKGLVFTVHDLVPGIESDLAAFHKKTQLMLDEAASVFTLTGVAADLVFARFGRRPIVIPHGFAVEPAIVSRSEPSRPKEREPALLAFGAMRANRQFVSMVQAWCTLPVGRVPLDVVLRSVGSADRERYRAELIKLQKAAAENPDLSVEIIDRMLSQQELVDRCLKVDALILPYRSITHSGQLELARDLGIRVVLPDVPTLRAQLVGAVHPCVWFPPATLSDPARFAPYLQQVEGLPAALPIQAFRRREHSLLIRILGTQYRFAWEAGGK